MSDHTTETMNVQPMGEELDILDVNGDGASNDVDATLNDTDLDIADTYDASTQGDSEVSDQEDPSKAAIAIQALISAVSDITGLDINRDIIPVLHDGWFQGVRPVRALLNSGLLTENIVNELLIQHVGFLAIEPMSITAETAKMIPQWFCEQHSIIPARFDGETLTVVSLKNPRMLIKAELEALVECPVVYRLTSNEALMACLASLPGRRALDSSDSDKDDLAAGGSVTGTTNYSIKNWEALLQEDDDGTLDVPHHIETMLARAIAVDASDIHIQTELTSEGNTVVTANLRRLGDLVPHDIYSTENGYKIINRLKVAGGFDVDPTKPCDGRYDITIPGSGRYDLRLAGMPLSHGQMLVVRLLPQIRKGKKTLDELFPAEYSDLSERIHKISTQPEGMLLVVGSTGSGKSTTLAATIRPLAQNQSIKVVTVEDPVENLIRGAQQVAVTPRLGFGDALRGFLRSDPDVILLGEIRDQDTAGMAIRAAQTGHIVFSTLHASNVEMAPRRLAEMGVPCASLADVLLGILSQRLVKTLCTLCSSGLKRIRRTPKPRGCDACASTGWGGRIAIAEFLEVTPKVASLIADNASTRQIREAAQITTYSQFAAKLIDGGVTTREAVVSKLGDLYDPSFETIYNTDEKESNGSYSYKGKDERYQDEHTVMHDG